MAFLEFEAPIEKIYQQLDTVKKQAKKKKSVEIGKKIESLLIELQNTKEEIYGKLTPWQKVQLSRHPDRPHTLDYIDLISDNFTQLYGDRLFKDDKAIIGGLGKIADKSFMFIGHQKGKNTKSRQFRNFGMDNPEGYRKALRLMKLAEKFNKPVISFIDTPGAYPGLEAEERGQAEAIARNIFEMSALKVPIICVIIGEGASGGALGIGVGDRTLMLENTWYSVISPESCASILWRSWKHKEKAAEQLKLTAQDMQGFGIVDQIIREPLGGAHNDPESMAEIIKNLILETTKQLESLSDQELINKRINKYASIGKYRRKAVEKVSKNKK